MTRLSASNDGYIMRIPGYLWDQAVRIGASERIRPTKAVAKLLAEAIEARESAPSGLRR